MITTILASCEDLLGSPSPSFNLQMQPNQTQLEGGVCTETYRNAACCNMIDRFVLCTSFVKNVHQMFQAWCK